MATQFSPGTVTVTQETPDIAALRLEGEFDLATAPLILSEAERCLQARHHVIIDLNGATFIDSAAVDAVLRVHRLALHRGGAVVVELAGGGVVERTLEISGIARLVPRAETRADAIRRLARETPRRPTVGRRSRAPTPKSGQRAVSERKPV